MRSKEDILKKEINRLNEEISSLKDKIHITASADQELIVKQRSHYEKYINLNIKYYKFPKLIVI